MCTRGSKCKFLHEGEPLKKPSTTNKWQKNKNYVGKSKYNGKKESGTENKEKKERLKSQYPGVLHEPSRSKLCWRAVAKRDGKRHYIGFYATEEEAHKARQEFNSKAKKEDE